MLSAGRDGMSHYSGLKSIADTDEPAVPILSSTSRFGGIMSATSSRIGPSELPLRPATTRPIIPPQTSSLKDEYKKAQKISLALKRSNDAVSEQLDEYN